MTGGVILDRHESDVAFSFNKYGEPEMLNLKDTVAQGIINALFMVPGNLPSLPHIGVNIRQYLYRSDTGYIATEIEQKLKEACGVILNGVVINWVDFSVQKTTKGESVFLLMIRLTFPKTLTDPGEESVLGVSVVQKKELVKFNFAYTET